MMRRVRASGLLVDVLGSLRASIDEREIDLGPPKQRAVFLVLAVRAGTSVSRDELIDRVWGEEPPATARGSLHTYVSGLRSALGTHQEALVGDSAGYGLKLAEDAVDERVVERLVARSGGTRAAGDDPAALADVDDALALWRSRDALMNVPGPFAAEQRTRIAALRLRLLIDRTQLMMSGAPPHADIAAAADRLSVEVADAPYDERLRVVLMSALRRSGRTGDALAEYDSLRRRLAADLGIDPSAPTKAAHAAILADEPDRDHASTSMVSNPPAPTPAVPAPAVPAPAVPQNAATSAPPPVPSQLPPDDSAFVGRAEEFEQIMSTAATAGSPRMMSIVGIGGVGKTTLAVRAGHRLREMFPDGQVYLDLRGFDVRHPPLSPAAAIGHLLASAGVGSVPQGEAQRVTLWRSLVADRRMLILLDNASSSDQVEDLLPGSPGCFVIVTSRSRLPGLSVRHGARRATLGSLTDAESRRLLTDAVGVERVDAEPDAARSLVRLCDGLPFALRIAAEQVDADPDAGITALVDRLGDARQRLDALELADDELGSIRSVLSCSLQALSPDGSRLFALLGAIPVTSTTDLAVAALMGVETERASAILGELCSLHLLARSHGRFAMHDLTRAYAAEVGAAIADDERREALGRLVVWYVATLAMHPSTTPPFDLPASPHRVAALEDQSAVLRWCVPEMSNLIALVRNAQIHGHHELTWQLAFVLYRPFYAFGDTAEWLEVLRLATRSADALGDRRARAMMLNHATVVYAQTGRYDLAVERIDEALRVLGDDPWSYRVSVTGNAAAVLLASGDYEAGYELAVEGLRRAEELQDDYYMSSISSQLCELSVRLGNFRDALVHGEPGLEIARRSGNVLPEVDLLVYLGRAAEGLEDAAAAEIYFADAVRLCADLGYRQLEGLGLMGLARLRSARGDAASLLEGADFAERALACLESHGAKEAAEARDLLDRLRLEVS